MANKVFQMKEGINYSLYINKYIYSSGDIIEMTLNKYNVSNQEKKFRYNTSQYYDFIIKKDEQVIWRWSEGKYFLQSLQFKLLEPGQDYSAQEVWEIPDDLNSGVYKVEGINLAFPQVKLEVSIKVNN
ncbi:MAG: hypothetical protein KAX49_08760 [Halanaerobiales bacterium]|nr:hypothetical protein [Halanaerobiales bacterium]